MISRGVLGKELDCPIVYISDPFNTLKPVYKGSQFCDNFKCFILKEKFRLLIQIWQTFITRGPIGNKAALVQVMD